ARILRRAALLRRSLVAGATAFVAVVFAVAFLLFAMRRAGDDVADGMGRLLAADALASLQHAVEEGAHEIDEAHSRSEIALYAFAREVESRLGNPLGAASAPAGGPDADPAGVAWQSEQLEAVVPLVRWLAGEPGPALVRF